MVQAWQDGHRWRSAAYWREVHELYARDRQMRDALTKHCPIKGAPVDRVSSARSGLSPTQFGTAVHKDLSDQVNGLKDPDLKAERSFLKSTGV
jgi:hypothetical protein